MQTVYILKNCIKSYSALVKLYKTPHLSTVIIIVGKKQSKHLLLDKRVKEFPFIINTLPTSIGLIPKIAKVLPLRLFLTLRNHHCRLKQKNKLSKKQPSKNSIQKINTQDGGIEIILNK